MDKRIYIAGPEVFNPKVDEIFKRIDKICVMAGFKAVFPQDNDFTNPKEIFDNNMKLIESSDAIIANLNPFRGEEPDSGTVFECAYGFSNGKPVIAYTSRKSTMEIKKLRNMVDGRWVDEDGMIVESYGNPVNLMLSESITVITGDFVDALFEYSLYLNNLKV